MVSESVLDIVLLFLYNSFDELKIELLNRCHGRVTLADSLERAILKQGEYGGKHRAVHRAKIRQLPVDPLIGNRRICRGLSWRTCPPVYSGCYKGAAYPIIAVAWSPLSLSIASASHDALVQVWDLPHEQGEAPQSRTLRSHSGGVRSIAWSPDDAHIASGSKDGIVQVWNVATGECTSTYRGHKDWVDSVAWSPDGIYIASGSWDSSVKVWQAEQLQLGLQQKFPEGNVITYHGHNSYIFSIAWSPDGKRIASASKDATVQIWDVASGRRIFTYRGHTSGVKAVAWSPNGKYIASGGDDQTVQVWVAP